jgi:glycine oxidase
MSTHPDVLILGGGVIGLTTAWFLTSRGATVALLDSGDLGQQASWAGAGILPPGDPAHARTPYELLRAHSSRMYPSLSAELRAQTGIDNGYVACGGIELPDPVEPDPRLPTEEWHTEGISFHLLDHAQLRNLEPSLASLIGQGVHLPEMAQVRNPRHVRALAAGCQQRGATLLPHRAATALSVRAGRVEGVQTDAGPLHAGRYLIAAGAWSDDLLRPLGWRPGVKPIRGQIALLNTGKLLLRHILMQGKRYLVPRLDGRILAGSTEEDAGFDPRPTAGAIEELLRFALGLVPSLANATLERSWAGLRPGSPDGLPYLGAVPGVENLFVATGHFRAGLLLSPATGLVMAELLTAQPPSVPLESFRLDRP